MKTRQYLLTLLGVVGIMLGSSSVALAQTEPGDPLDLQSSPFFAVLVGGNEISGQTGLPGSGDPNGFGSATVILRGSGKVCFGLVLHGIRVPTVTHIHERVAGANGPVMVDFIGGDSTIVPVVDGGQVTASGCVAGDAIKDPAVLGRIRRNPANFYINVHNADFPGGALRGQLF